MPKETKPLHRPHLNLELVHESIHTVEAHWQEINDALDAKGIGRKDTFSYTVRDNILIAYAYLNELLKEGVVPFSVEGISEMLTLNHLIHYGNDRELRREYRGAILATCDKFDRQIVPIADWYNRHVTRGDHPMKLAVEVYVSILGRPQLFIEGNHRTGNLIANWITVFQNKAPYVLSAGNAIAYFAPSAEIKSFSDKSSWRGQMQLPKYHKKFLEFWQKYADKKFLITGA